MNDTPDSGALQPLAQSALGLVDALADPQETRPAKADTPPPPSKAWTHRFKESGQPASSELFDQIWLSPALAGQLQRSTTSISRSAAAATAAPGFGTVDDGIVLDLSGFRS